MTNDHDAALTEMIAHHRIRDCLNRLARGEDRRDAALIGRAFWPDAAVDFGIFAGSFDDYLAWVVPGAASVPVTLHTLGQSFIVLDGDTAAVETHVAAYHRVDFGADDHDVMLVGRYLDRFVRRGGAWRIAHRRMVYDWTRDLGVAVDWSQGLMGMAFSGDAPVGAATGDASVGFLDSPIRSSPRIKSGVTEVRADRLRAGS